MTKLTKSITIISIATTLLLGSCSSKFGSREEAKNAAINYRGKEGKTVVVSYKASADKIRWETQDRQQKINSACDRNRQGMNAQEPVKPKRFYTQKQRQDYNKARIAFTYKEQSRAFFLENCSPIPRIVLGKKEIEKLTRFEKEQTIECNEEKETKQFVCKKWRTDKTKMDSDEWFSLKPNYSYFRY